MESANSFEAKFQRLLLATGEKSDSGLARILGIHASSILPAKKRKKIPTGWVEQISEKFNVSADWLFFGRGSMHPCENAITNAKQPAAVAESPEPYGAPGAEEIKMSDMLTKTAEVLESETIYRTALASNINAFHQAVRSERTLARLEERVAILEARIDEVVRENRELRLSQELSSLDKAVGEEG